MEPGGSARTHAAAGLPRPSLAKPEERGESRAREAWALGLGLGFGRGVGLGREVEGGSGAGRWRVHEIEAREEGQRAKNPELS
eukprot:4092172-Pleurochrysis_carterae.AAC.3